MSDTSPTGHAIVNSLRSSLKLVCSSLELLTYSQLHAMEWDLEQTAPIISAQLESKKAGNSDLVLDLDDWESALGEGGSRSENKAGGSGSGKECSSASIPGPYPAALPPINASPDSWYVVDCGKDVGIFSDNASSTHAVSGVPGGHQVKVKTWYAAVALYNKLYCEGKIIRVHS